MYGETCSSCNLFYDLRSKQDFIAPLKTYYVLDLLEDLKKGKRGAIAKAITIVENDPKESKKLLKKIFKNTGNSMIIGITGPAGAGKSSLINKTAVE